MRTLLTCTALTSIFVIAAACGPKNQGQTQQPTTQPTATTGAYPGYPPGYPAQGQYPQGEYPQQGQYPQPAPTYGQQPYPAPPATAPAPAPAPGPAPGTTGQMAVPGPVAFQCQNDVPCGTHHCNLQYGKCAFPCQSAVDCIAPNQCIAGLCVPAPPQAH